MKGIRKVLLLFVLGLCAVASSAEAGYYFQYDSGNRLTQLISVQEDELQKTKYTYNLNGNLISKIRTIVPYETIRAAGRTVVGDYNGDGRDDVATVYDEGNDRTSVLVWPATGNGVNFRAPALWWEAEQFSAGQVYGLTTSGDYNGDGKDDIAVFYDYGNNTTRLHWWESTGTGFIYHWGAWSSSQLNADRIRHRVVSGDFNGDGKAEVAAMYGAAGEPTRIDVWKPGSGALFTHTSGVWTTMGYTASMVNGRIAAGDYNGDGRDDIAAMYEYANGEARIHVWTGTTGGGFTYTGAQGWWAIAGFWPGETTGRMAAGDYNGDGKDDVAVIYDYGSSGSKIHEWRSTGTAFQYRWGIWEDGAFAAGSATYKMGSGDLDGDGKDDVVALVGGANEDIKVWKGPGFVPGLGFDSSRMAGRTVVGDYNGDGRDDAAAMYDAGGNHTSVLVWPATGNGVNFHTPALWWEAEQFSASQISGLTTSGDYDGDGKDDIAVFYDYGSNTTRLHWWKSTGTGFAYHWGAWSSVQLNADRIRHRVVSGDFNGDGKAEVAAMYGAAGEPTRIDVWKPGSGTSFAHTSGVWTTTGYTASVVNGRIAAGDYNGDGRDDIAAMYEYANGEARIHVWTGTTGGGFTYTGAQGWWSMAGFGPGATTGRLVAGDYNGDGRDDVAVIYDYGAAGSKIHEWRSTGTAFQYRPGVWEDGTLAAGTATYKMGSGDLDGDGKDDVVAFVGHSSNPEGWYEWYGMDFTPR